MPPSVAMDHRKRWLAGPILAAYCNHGWHSAQIVPAGNDHVAWINVGIGAFRCGVEFDEAGNPTTLVNCKANNDSLVAVPERIALKCVVDTGAHAVDCSGTFMVQSDEVGASGMCELQLYRKLHVDERVP